MTDPWTATPEPLRKPCLRERLTVWSGFVLWLIGRRRIAPALYAQAAQAATRLGDRTGQQSPMRFV